MTRTCSQCDSARGEMFTKSNVDEVMVMCDDINHRFAESRKLRAEKRCGAKSDAGIYGFSSQDANDLRGCQNCKGTGQVNANAPLLRYMDDYPRLCEKCFEGACQEFGYKESAG